MVTAITIPEWTRDDYIKSSEPYEWLYKFKDNRFKMTQLVEQIRAQAGNMGVKNFMSIWKNYLETMQSQYGGSSDGDNMTEFTVKGDISNLQCGEYICDDSGITIIDKYGTETEVISHPLIPIKRLISIDTGTEKLELAYRNGRKGWRTIIADKATIASSNKIIELAPFGIAVNSENAKYVIKYLSEMEAINYDDIPEQKSVGRLGWIEGHGFSPYSDNMIFDGDANYHEMFNAVQSVGSRDKWIDLVKETRKKGNIVVRMMFAASFASVLLQSCNAQSFFLHLWGTTGKGKTVAMMLGASAWAYPKMGNFVTSYNSTGVGKEMVAGFLNSLPMCIDEFQISENNNKQTFDRDIYKLTQGSGKTRGAKNGGLQTTVKWNNCILSTGEFPISTSSSAAGALNRIIEINCNGIDLFDDPVGVINIINENYGFAGREFIDHLSTPEGMEMACKAQEFFKESILDGTDITGKQAIPGSLILAADFLIDQWIFHDGITLSKDDIMPYLLTNEQVDQNVRCHEWIKEFVVQNYARFGVNNCGEYNGEIWGDTDADYIYFIRSVFERKLADNGFNAAAYLEWARQNNKIECADKRTTKQKRLFKIPQPVWCVWIRKEVIDYD